MKLPRITRLPDWLDRLQPSEPVVIGGAALLIGLGSGMGVWLFKKLIGGVQAWMFQDLGAILGHLGGWTVLVLPVLGGLVVGLVIHYLVGEERHHGVAGIMEAVALAGGRLRYRRMPAKAVAAAISIGSGASVGPEDPSVQIGANLGSMMGQLLRLSDQRVRALVAAGAAGGIAAAFNAPIAGVFFALELILGELAGGSLGIILVAAVVSAIFTQAVSGPQPAFGVPAYQFRSYLELPFYIGLGLLSGPIAALYVRLIYVMQDLFLAIKLPRWSKPVLAGLVVGLVGIFLPQVFGVGYDTIGKILAKQELILWILIALLVAKLLLTPLSLGGGFPGGVIAPSLFIGANLGAAYAVVLNQVFPALVLEPPAYAMVGMAAVLAGAVHAPLTAIILLFEMTNDYRIILPLMFAVTLSLVVSQRLQRDSLYMTGLARKGIRLERGRDVEVLEEITVGEVMQTAFQTLRETDTIAQAKEVFLHTRHHGMAVVDLAGELVGILTVQDLDRAVSEEADQVTVGEICTHSPLCAYPDETMGTALRRMSTRDIGRLPVVGRDRPRQLLGILSRTDIVRAYDLALSRRATLRHRAQQVRMGAVRGEDVSVIEVDIEPGAVCVGKQIKDISWPEGCLVASLRRGPQLIIPHGDSVLKAGDVLVVVAEVENHAQIHRLCKGEKDTL